MRSRCLFLETRSSLYTW